MSTLITGISELLTNDPAIGEGVGRIKSAALLIENGVVAWTGPAATAPPADSVIDVGGRAVFPGFVDSHSHLVFGGDRVDEFVARMAGQTYAAGGIKSTVAATREASDDDLRVRTAKLVAEMLRQGTTTVEIKSGYGLTVQDEARSLRIAAEFTSETTYLGAHVVPAGLAADEYVGLVTGDMLKACAPHAKWIDVFCERGAFDADQARAVLTAGKAVGLGLRIHANQLGPGPGVRLGCELGAAAVDHVTYIDDEDISALAQTGTVATLLPGVEFSTKHPYPDARRLLDAGVVVALASDCNPGSCFTSSLAFCITLAVREMGLTPDQAIWAATAGGARALRRTDVGHLGVGAQANFVVLDAPAAAYLAYRPGVPLVRDVWSAGRQRIGPGSSLG